MDKDEVKEIFNSITCIRILITKDQPEKADNVAWQLQKDMLTNIMDDNE